MPNPFSSGPDPIQQQANAQVAEELGLPNPNPQPVMSVPAPLDPSMPSNAPRASIVDAGAAPNYLSQIGGVQDVAATMDKNAVPYAVAPNSAGQPQLVPVAAQQAVANGTNPAQYATPVQQAAPKVPNMADIKLPEEAQKYLGESDVQKKANEAIGVAESQKAAADAAAFSNAQQQMATSQAKLTDLHNKFESEFGAKMLDMDATTKQLANQDFTSPKIDGNNFWATRSAPQSILAGIAMALGAVGGAFSGTGKNSAVDVINKAIDRDIEIQKVNAQKTMQEKQMKSQGLRDQLGAQQNMLTTLRAKYGDESQAILAQKAMALEATQMQIQKNAANTQNVEVRKKYEIINSQIEQQKQQTVMSLKQSMYQRQVLQQALGEGDPSKITPEAMSYLDPESRKIIEDRRERYVPGWGEALTKEGATKFRDASAEGRTVLDNIAKIGELSKELHGLSPLTDRGRVEEARSRIAALVGPVNKLMNKTGRLSEVDLHQAEKILGDPTANLALKSVQLKKINTAAKLLQDDLNNQAAANGVQRKVYTDFDAPIKFPTKPLQ